MAENVKLASKITTKYIKSPDHRVVYADGALIGMAAGRAITVDFFSGDFEPIDEVVELDSNGAYQQKIDTSDERLYLRERQVQIILTPENAEDICNKILARVNQFKQ